MIKAILFHPILVTYNVSQQIITPNQNLTENTDILCEI